MRVRYGKPIKVRSILGKCDVSFTYTSSNTTQAWFIRNNQVRDNVGGTEFTFNQEQTHKYFVAIKTSVPDITDINCGATGASSDSYFSDTVNQIYSCVVYWSDSASDRVLRGYFYNNDTKITPISGTNYYGILIDLTAIGLDNLTAEQFYNKYNKYFSLIATGEEITIDDKVGQIAYKNLEEDSIRCKVAGGSSDIYYGYNSIFDFSTSIWTNDNADTFTMTKTADKLSFECHTAGSRNNKGITTNILVVAGHKYLLSYDILSTVSYNLDTSRNTVSPSTVINMYPTSVVANELTNVQMIVQAENNLTWRTGRGSTTVAVGDTIEFTNIYIIDLTDWFGADKEPTTVQEFKEKFTKDYYGYCPTSIKLTRYQIEALPSYGYNQLSPNSGNASGSGITTTKDNGIFTINGTSTSAMHYINNAWQFIQNHKYLAMATVYNYPTTLPYLYSAGMQVYGASSGTTIISNAIQVKDIPQNGFISFFATASATGYASFRFRTDSGVTYSNTKIIPQCIDLTDWYGEGNEPTTIEEFKATFPNLYYPYSKKRLLNKYMINKLEN